MPTAALTSKQRQFLKAAAHHLKPVIHIGKGGLSDAVTAEIDAALSAQELIKVKIHDNSPARAELSASQTRRSVAAELCSRVAGAQHVDSIGHTLVLFRQNPSGPTRYRLPRPPRPVMPAPPAPVITPVAESAEAGVASEDTIKSQSG